MEGNQWPDPKCQALSHNIAQFLLCSTIDNDFLVSNSMYTVQIRQVAAKKGEKISKLVHTTLSVH